MHHGLTVSSRSFFVAADSESDEATIFFFAGV